jgi:hypothetical protein
LLAGLVSRRWLARLFAAIGLYLLFIPVWLFAVEGVAWVAGHAAAFFYSLFDSTVSIHPVGDSVSVTVKASAQGDFAGQAYTSALAVAKVTYGMPLVAALSAVTRADSALVKFRAAAAGLLVMLLLSVPAVMMWAKLADLQFEERMAQATVAQSGDRSSFFYYAFHGYAFSQPVVAVAVWIAMVMLGLFKNKRQRAQAAPVARNAACPCGSGRKFKKCCGSSQGK